MDGVWRLNGDAIMPGRLDDERCRRLWSSAGLGVRERLSDERLFEIGVVHLAPIMIRRKPSRSSLAEGEGKGYASFSAERVVWEADEAVDAEAGDVWGSWPEDAALRRAARAAVRALYALGLDAGTVEIALGGDGRTAVRSARAELERGGGAAAGFAAWYERARAQFDGGRRVLIGADPEFALVTPAGKVAPASRYFGAGAGGAAGADALLVGRRLLYPVAELRPAPAADPAALAANVRRLLRSAAAQVRDPELRWVAGAMPVPGLALGGHIHISGAPLTGRLLRLLDTCAAYPLALVEDPAGRGRRPRYGALGDFRRQPHGGFEYRTLPSWLVSPAAAKAAFALALLCAREAHRIPRIPACGERYAAAYYAGDRTELAGCLDEVAACLAATDSYAPLARYIEPLLDAAARGATWSESADIRTKWRIPLRL